MAKTATKVKVRKKVKKNVAEGTGRAFSRSRPRPARFFPESVSEKSIGQRSVSISRSNRFMSRGP